MKPQLNQFIFDRLCYGAAIVVAAEADALLIVQAVNEDAALGRRARGKLEVI